MFLFISSAERFHKEYFANFPPYTLRRLYRHSDLLWERNLEKECIQDIPRPGNWHICQIERRPQKLFPLPPLPLSPPRYLDANLFLRELLQNLCGRNWEKGRSAEFQNSPGCEDVSRMFVTWLTQENTFLVVLPSYLHYRKFGKKGTVWFPVWIFEIIFFTKLTRNKNGSCRCYERPITINMKARGSSASQRRNLLYSCIALELDVRCLETKEKYVLRENQFHC